MIRRFAVALGSFAVAALALAAASAACFPTYEFHVPEAGPDTGADSGDASAVDGDTADAP